MTIKTQVGAKIVFTGVEMKEIKNMLKGQKVNRQFNSLNCIKFDVSAENAKVTYSTNEMKIIKKLNMLEGIPGSFLVPMDIIKKATYIKNDNVYTFEYEPETLKLRFNNNGIKQSVNTHDADEYPTSPYIKNLKTAGVITYADIKTLKSAAVSTSKMETRPVLTYAVLRDNRIVSTDSHRLFQGELEGINTQNDVFLHQDFIKAFAANENKKGLYATVKYNNELNYTLIETDTSSYLYNNTGGNYPDTSRLIPENFDNVFTILDITHFKNVLENINKLTKSAQNRVMKIKVIDDYTIILSSKQPETGAYIAEEINIKSDYVTKDFTILLSSQYLTDAIKQITNRSSNSIQLSFTGAMRPFIVNEVNNDSTFGLVLPIRTF